MNDSTGNVTMKFALPLLGLVLLVTAGCQNKKPDTTTASALDLGSSNAAAMQPTPAAYTPPVAQPMAVDASLTTPTATVTPTMNAAVAGGSTYTVQKGDTLWKIAASHYGDGKKWQQIASANPGLTPSRLKVGQTITLP